jgi:hypothetical protein
MRDNLALAEANEKRKRGKPRGMKEAAGSQGETMYVGGRLLFWSTEWWDVASSASAFVAPVKSY